MVPCHNIHGGVTGHLKQAEKPFYVVAEFAIAAKGAFIQQIAQNKHQFRPMQGHGRLERPVHLPFAPQLVQPVSFEGTQQMGIGDYQNPYWGSF